LRQCLPGDEAFFYHPGSDRCVRGRVTVESEPSPHWQADCDCGVEKEDRLAVVDVAHKAALREPVTLVQVKSQPEFAEFHLEKFGRLSVMPVSDEHWERVIEMGGGVA
ncbi:MAG: EVE domain-containing protein, partial [Candidatus Poseidoniia archaeon]|nr:EVE domain-containing protein [Candidatus Poseidoniia archaeon]